MANEPFYPNRSALTAMEHQPDIDMSARVRDGISVENGIALSNKVANESPDTRTAIEKSEKIRNDAQDFQPNGRMDPVNQVGDLARDRLAEANIVNQRNVSPTVLNDMGAISGIHQSIGAGQMRELFNVASEHNGNLPAMAYDVNNPVAGLNQASQKLGANWQSAMPPKGSVLNEMGGQYAYTVCRDAQQQELVGNFLNRNGIGSMNAQQDVTGPDGKQTKVPIVIVPGDELKQLNENKLGGLQTYADTVPVVDKPLPGNVEPWRDAAYNVQQNTGGVSAGPGGMR